jgi:hypothetical protein
VAAAKGRGMPVGNPPKNNAEVTEAIRRRAAYSARKKSTKGMAESSVMNPATSSDSDSGRSKGTRLVSARAAGRKIAKIGKSAISVHPPS